jgi:hypothetical protein
VSESGFGWHSTIFPTLISTLQRSGISGTFSAFFGGGPFCFFFFSGYASPSVYFSCCFPSEFFYSPPFFTFYASFLASSVGGPDETLPAF